MESKKQLTREQLLRRLVLIKEDIESLYKKLDAMFNEIKYTDELDDEMTNHQADMEAQDYDVFGENKI